eukprot:2066417-Prymnesium_polylepis.1
MDMSHTRLASVDDHIHGAYATRTLSYPLCPYVRYLDAPCGGALRSRRRKPNRSRTSSSSHPQSSVPSNLSPTGAWHKPLHALVVIPPSDPIA